MSPPNRDTLEAVARMLGDIREEVVFVGGQVTELLITAPTLARMRYTDDVDVICPVATLSQYATLSDRLRSRGFMEDSSEGAPLCRWRSAAGILDVMPTVTEVLRFGNPWYHAAYERAIPHELAPDLHLRIISAPLFLATKWLAFRERGRDDPFSSRDVEDIVSVVAGRPELLAEIEAETAELRGWLGENARAFLASEDAADVLDGILPPERLAPGVRRLVWDRFARIAAAAHLP